MNMDTRFFFHLSTLAQRKIVYFYIYNYYDVYIYSYDIINNNNNDDFLEQFFCISLLDWEAS